MKSRFAPGETSHRRVERPDEWRAAHGPVYARSIDARSVKDLNGVENRWVREQASSGVDGLEKILIALDHAAQREAVNRFRNKNLRFDFGVYCLREHFVESQAKQE